MEILRPLGPVSTLHAASVSHSQWVAGQGAEEGLASCPLRRDLGELCGSGSGWERAVMPCVGVHVNLCPTGHRARQVGSSHEAQLPGRQSSPGGSQWNTCLTLAVCPLPGTAHSPPVPPRGAGPLAPQREAPLRGSYGITSMEHSEFGEQESGTGAWAWGAGWPSRPCPWHHA